MPRKFHLSVNHKNEFRKRRDEKEFAEQDSESLTMSIPKKIFNNAVAPSLLQLKERVQKAPIFPWGMNCARSYYAQIMSQIMFLSSTKLKSHPVYSIRCS